MTVRWHARRLGFWGRYERELPGEPVDTGDQVITNGSDDVITNGGDRVIVNPPLVANAVVNASGDTLINAGGDSVVQG